MTKNNRERLIKLVVKYCDVLIQEGRKEEVLALLENEMRHVWKGYDKNHKGGKDG